MVHLLVEGGARRRWPGIASRRGPPPTPGPAGACGRPFEVGEGGVVGGDHARPGRRPRSTCCRPSCGLPCDRPRMAAPRYSMTWPMPPPVPMRPMMARIMSLAVTPAGRSPSTVTAMVFGPALGQGLGGQHVLDLAGADPEGQGAEGPVGRGVAVAAHDGHARLGQAQLGADDVDDPLVAGRPSGRAGCRTRRSWRPAPPSAGPRSDPRSGSSRPVVGTLWSMVATVRSGRRTVAAGQAQAVEGLGRGDLVDQVQVDVEQVGLAVGAVDDVALPDLVGQGARCWCHQLASHILRYDSRTSGRECKRCRVLDKAVAHPRRPGDRAAGPGRPGRRHRLPRATAHRLAVALERHGLVGRDDAGRFVLGPRLVSLGRAAGGPGRRSLVEAAAPGPGAPAGRHRGERPAVRARRIPADLRGLARIAPQPAHHRRRRRRAAHGPRLGRQGPRRASPTPSGAGWAQSVEERERGVASVSAPVVVDGGVVAAVSVSGPIERTTRQPGRRYAAAVVAAARAVERALAAGRSGPAGPVPRPGLGGRPSADAAGWRGSEQAGRRARGASTHARWSPSTGKHRAPGMAAARARWASGGTVRSRRRDDDRGGHVDARRARRRSRSAGGPRRPAAGRAGRCERTPPAAHGRQGRRSRCDAGPADGTPRWRTGPGTVASGQGEPEVAPAPRAASDSGR